MSQKLTRRELASVLAASSALPPPLSGQAAPEQPEDLLRNAREQVARSSEQLSKYAVAANIEPAFVFKP